MTLIERELRQRAFDAGRALSVAVDEKPETVILEEAMVPAFEFLLNNTRERQEAGEAVSLEQQIIDLVTKFRKPVIVVKKKIVRRPNDEKEVEKMLRGVREDANPFSLVGEPEESGID
jgi:hypothetical protein